MSATLVAKDLAAGHGDARPVLRSRSGRRPRRRGRPRRRQRCGQVHAAAPAGRPGHPGGRQALAQPAHRHRRPPPAGARPPPGRDRTGLLRPPYGRDRRPARPGHRHPGAGRRAARRGRRLRHGAGALARAGRCRPGRARRGDRRAARPVHQPRPADDDALRRSGGPCLARLAAALPLRHLPAGRAHQRPRSGRPAPPGVLRHGAARRHRPGQPRPRVPDPHGHPRRRTRPRPAAGQHLRRRLRLLPGGARAGPASCARAVRGVRRHQGRSGDRGRTPSATGWRRASRTPAARLPTTTRSAARPAWRPPRSRPPRPSRPSA